MCGTPKKPDQAPPPPTELPQAASEVDQAVIQARARERARNRSLFGHTRTILTGGRGLEGVQTNLARRTLLGSRSDSQELNTSSTSTILSGGPSAGAQTGTAVAPPSATSNLAGGFTGGAGTGFSGYPYLTGLNLSRGGLF